MEHGHGCNQFVVFVVPRLGGFYKDGETQHMVSAPVSETNAVRKGM